MTAASLTATKKSDHIVDGAIDQETTSQTKLRVQSYSIAVIDTYATGGVTWDLSASFTEVTLVVGGGSGYLAGYDYGTVAAGKLMLYYGNYDASDGVLIEPNGVDVTTATVRVMVYGFTA